ncbi:hypothetical protein SORBI_3005G052250 [Sorghum bicolor]|uniref:Uncharacterized protein n=1 Tax=Sorghum bicolor TaxID=4558 RepID=A0A1Z5RHP7_SORBI|nr:hypothetical protein SORBI_3005G052250 [Sorghum bicolor]
MAYTTTFQAIARMFMLAMRLSKSKRNHRISSWRREYPSCVTKVTSKHKDRNLEGFFVYNFMKLWDGVRLSPINNLSRSLRTEFLAEILASRANECYDNIPEDIQYLIKKLEKM